MTLQQPTDPRFGSRLSASEFRARVTNPLYANDVSLDDRMALLEAVVASMPYDYKQAFVPDTANERDRWIDTSDNNQMWYCWEGYGSGELDKASKWLRLGDSVARNNADSAVQTAGLATKTVFSSTPPLAFTKGWIWVDEGNGNREMRCVADYLETDGPDAYPDIKSYRRSRFVATDSWLNAQLAAAEQGLQDGKTYTYVQSLVPDHADAHDTWIKDSDFSAYIAIEDYKSTDHEPYNSGLTYEFDDVVTQGGILYRAKGAVPENTAPPNVTFWLDAGPAFPTVNDFRLSLWVPTTDPATVQLAADIQGLRDGKTNTFFQANFPEAAEARDIFVSSNNGQAYICLTSYNASLPVVDRPSKWSEVADQVARAAIDSQLSIADGLNTTYLQPTTPSEADIKDIWIDTTDDVFEIYICTASYTTGTSPVGKWKLIQDGTKAKTHTQDSMPTSAKQGDIWIDTDDTLNRRYICTQTYTANPQASYWVDLKDDRKQTFYLPDPPAAAEAGDGWLDTVTPTGQFQFYICNESYSNAEHGFVVDGGGNVTSSGKWTAARDIQAENTANLALNVANGKTSTYYLPTMPEKADMGDFWIDTDDVFPGTPYYMTRICTASYDMTPGGAEAGANPTTILTTKWNTYADPVSYDTANQAVALADNQRKTLYSDTTPNADDHPEGIRQGDLWVDTDDHAVYVSSANQPNGSGQTPGAWTPITTQSSLQAQLTAQNALEVAQAAKAVQDGVMVVYTTSGVGDAGWPGPGSLAGGTSNQWAVSNWLVGQGARLGDIWIHHNTSNGIRSALYCKTEYDGYADGDLGSLAHWENFVDGSLQGQIDGKLNLSGGAMTGAIGFIASQQFNGASLSLSGGGTIQGALAVNTAPTVGSHVVRKTELDPVSSTASSALSAANTAQSTADTAQSTASNALTTANTAQTEITNARSGASSLDTRIDNIANTLGSVTLPFFGNNLFYKSGTYGQAIRVFGSYGLVKIEIYDDIPYDRFMEMDILWMQKGFGGQGRAIVFAQTWKSQAPSTSQTDKMQHQTFDLNPATGQVFTLDSGGLAYSQDFTIESSLWAGAPPAGTDPGVVGLTPNSWGTPAPSASRVLTIALSPFQNGDLHYRCRYWPIPMEIDP